MSVSDKYCTNCKRNIGEQNFVLHIAHCQRNIQVCERCEEPVPRSEMKEHLEEFHVVVSCEKCDNRMERWQLEDHESECIKKPELCQYCELSVPHDELKEHEAYCGARSEKCPDCKQYVQIKDKRYHYVMCEKSELNKVNSQILCRGSNSMIKSDAYKAHQNSCRGKQNMNFQIHNSLSSSSSDEDVTFSSRSSDFSSRSYNKVKNTQHEDQSELLKQLSLKDSRGYRGDDQQSMQECINCRAYFVPLTTDCLSICGSCSIFSGRQYTQGIGRGTSVSFARKRNDYSGESTKPSFADATKARLEKQPLYTYGGEKTSVASKSEKSCVAEESKEWEGIACTKGWSYLVQSALTEGSKISQKVLEFEPPCMSCSKRFSVFEIDAHMATCVQRKESCNLCSKAFRIVDMENHLNDCAKSSEAKMPSSQSSVAGNRVREVHPVITNLTKRERRKIKKGMRKEEKQKAAAKNLPNVPAVQSFPSLHNPMFADDPPGAVSARFVVEEEVKIPCEFCNVPVNASELILHQSGCRPELLHFPLEDGSKKIRTNVSSKWEQEQQDFDLDIDESACYATASAAASKQNKCNEQRSANLSHQNNGNNTGKTVPAAENAVDEHSLSTKTNRVTEGFSNHKARAESAEKPKVTVVQTHIDLKTMMPVSITKQVDATRAILMRGRGKAKFPESRSVHQDSRPGEFLHNTGPQTEVKVVAPSTSRCTEGKSTFALTPECVNFLKEQPCSSSCQNAAGDDSRTDMKNEAVDNNMLKADGRDAFLVKEPDEIIKVNLFTENSASDSVKNTCKGSENVHIMKGGAKKYIVGVSANCGQQTEIAGSSTVPSASEKQIRKRAADSDIVLRRPLSRDQLKSNRTYLLTQQHLSCRR